MQLLSVLLCICGSALIVPVIIRFFWPLWRFSETLLEVLEYNEKTKLFLITHNINGFLLGATLILAGILPEPLKLEVCMPLLVLEFISVVVCNMITVGTPWAYVPPKKDMNK